MIEALVLTLMFVTFMAIAMTLIIRCALYHNEGWKYVWWHTCGMTTDSPQRNICPKCGATDPEYVSGIAKRGILWGWTYKKD